MNDTPTQSDFLDTSTGQVPEMGARRAAGGAAIDAALDATLRRSARWRVLLAAARTLKRRVLLIGVRVPGREEDLDRVAAAFAGGTCEIVTSFVPMGERSKFENLNMALDLAGSPLTSFDWIVAVDDDVVVPDLCLELLLQASEQCGLMISQPAHRFRSHCTYAVTRRRFGSLARATSFVEIGPVTAIRAAAFSKLLPFPVTRWCYGLDALWAQIAHDEDWKIGVIDACPIRHVRPVAGSYSRGEALVEGRAFLKARNVRLNRRELLVTREVCLST